jgi:sugar/nucleoside kinase (ribokinase family)
MRFPFQLKKINDFDAVGFGTNAVDHLISVPEYPAFNSKVELTGHLVAAGGEAASTMAGLRRLGLTTAYAGRFGDDREGDMGIQSLIDEGVDISYAERVPGARTQIAFSMIDERSGERTIIWHRDKTLAWDELDAPVAAARRGRVLHLTPHDTRACIRMAKAAKRSGVVVTIDVDNLFEGIDELLPLIDVCIASAEFPERLVGIPDTRTALRQIHSRFGCPVVGVTLGSSGSLFMCGDSFFETGSIPVPGGCVDTTGAGDAFRTGFLFGMLTGEPVESCARTANAVASLKCRRLGARDALPNINELYDLLKKS